MSINKDGIKVNKVRSKDPTVIFHFHIDESVGFSADDKLSGELHLTNKSGTAISTKASKTSGSTSNEWLLEFHFEDDDWKEEVNSGFRMNGHLDLIIVRTATTIDTFTAKYLLSFVPENSTNNVTDYEVDLDTHHNHVVPND